jgi:CelD/BcsL family acetyltransferase involved in cellulose biosynthesis
MPLAVLQISEVIDEAGLAALEPVWKDLFDRAAAPTPFQSWEWVSSWWAHHREGRLWILVARDNGVVVGLMPLRIERYRGSFFREVRWMGAPLSDYQDQVAAAGRETECAQAFLGHLGASTGKWDFADLNDIREGSPLVLGGDGLSSTVEFHRMCPIIKLQPTWDEYSKTLGKNLRANVGRRRRQLEKAFKTELGTVDDPAELTQAMDELYALHNTRWRKRGASGAFANKRVQAFHHEVARRFQARGWLRLHRLRLDGTTRGAFYCFHLGTRTYYYLSGFDAEIGKFSPGNVIMGAVIQRAITDGDRELDLLRGDETYKYQWNATDTKTERLLLGHATLRSRFGLGAHRFERFVEHRGLAIQRRLWGRRANERAKLSQPDVDAT